jgi:hyperosmotically inducible periplasmic protein
MQTIVSEMIPGLVTPIPAHEKLSVRGVRYFAALCKFVSSKAPHKERQIMSHWKVFLIALLAVTVFGAEEIQEFPAYVDSDLCAHLMLGPINTARVECSQKTHKDGSNPVVVRLRDNLVLDPNKQKPFNPLVGKFAQVSGEVKLKDGKLKFKDVKETTPAEIAASGQGRKVLDVRTHKAPNAKLYEEIRHELAMMPYISEFDFISFTLDGSDVILTGWTVRVTNRSTAYNIVKDIEGVESVTNNIDVLPLGSFDMQIRAGARAALARHLSRYFWGSGSDIKIVVKNGNIILLGSVYSKSDSDIATIQCNAVPGAFKVFNMLRVTQEQKKG